MYKTIPTIALLLLTTAACTPPTQEICEDVYIDKLNPSVQQCTVVAVGWPARAPFIITHDDDDRPKPDTPDEPDKPDTPDEPDTPDHPDTPDKPDTPDTPDKPRGPQGNNGLGNGDQTAPGNSGANNGAENEAGNPGHASGKPQNSN